MKQLIQEKSFQKNLKYIFSICIFIVPTLILSQFYHFPIMYDEIDYLRFLQVYPSLIDWSFVQVTDYFFTIGFDGHPPLNYLISFINWICFESILALRIQGALLFSLGSLAFFLLLLRTKVSPYLAFATACFFILLWPNLHISKTVYTESLQPLVISIYFLFRSLKLPKLTILSAILLVLTRETNIIFLIPFIVIDIKNKRVPYAELMGTIALSSYFILSWAFTQKVYSFSGSSFIATDNFFKNLISLITFDHIFYRPQFIFRLLFILLGSLVLVKSFIQKNLFAALLLACSLIHMIIFSLYDYSIFKPRLITPGLLPMGYALCILFKEKGNKPLSLLLLLFCLLHLNESFYIDEILKKTQVDRDQVETASKWLRKYKKLSDKGVFVEYPFNHYLSTSHYGLVSTSFKITRELKEDKFKLYLKKFTVSDFKNNSFDCPWNSCQLLEYQEFEKSSEVMALFEKK